MTVTLKQFLSAAWDRPEEELVDYLLDNPALIEPLALWAEDSPWAEIAKLEPFADLEILAAYWDYAEKLTRVVHEVNERQ